MLRKVNSYAVDAMKGELILLEKFTFSVIVLFLLGF